MTAPEVAVAPVTRGDGPALIAANLANRGHHRPWAEPFTDQNGFDDWFGRTIAGPAVALVAKVPDGGIAGVVTLSQIILGNFRSCYCGYYGMARLAGRGLMTETVRQAVDLAFAELGLHRVEANIQPENIRSIALVRRLGFWREGFSPGYLKLGGVWRDHERWALVNNEAKATKAGS